MGVSVSLQAELKQNKPFKSLKEEAHLSIQRTAALLEHAFESGLKSHRITGTQYNVLRILRGSEPTGLCRNEVGARLVRQVPDVTRLLDRLEAKKLVQRDRCVSDRRQVLCTITTAGLDLLRDSDAIVSAIESRSLGRLSDVKTRQLIRLLDAIREGHT